MAARKRKSKKGKKDTSSSGNEGRNNISQPLKALSEEEVTSRVDSLHGWSLETKDGRLIRDFAFKDFKGALDFLNRVGALVEELDHHPEIYNVYNQVSLALMTHSVDGISEIDIELAKRINELD